MWCKQCQQDAPGIVHKEDGKLYCTRCSSPMPESAPAPHAASHAAPTGQGRPAGQNAPATVPYDSWEAEEELRHIHRVLKGPGASRGRRGRRARLDGPHFARAARHEPAAKPRAALREPASERGDFLLVAIWSTIVLGVMALVCGGILLGWSVLGGRGELWSIGLPIALGGQIALLLALILQLDRLWWHNRRTAAKLDTVDEQLHDLRTTTAMLGTTHSSPAASFYAHWAGGASPQLLLGDLKGQLDLLAAKMAKTDE